MTIIFNTGDFWIESLEFEELIIPAGSLYDSIKLLERPGRFVGGTAVNIPPAGQFGKETSGILLQAVQNSIPVNGLTYGFPINGIRSLITNEEESQTTTIKLSAVIFLRR